MLVGMWSFVLALGLALAPPLAEDPVFLEGQRLYRDLEFDQAIFRFEEAARVIDREPKERARAFAWLGLAYAQVGDFDSARRAFRSAVLFDIETTLPEMAPPKVTEILEEERRERRAQAPATVAPGPKTPAPAQEAAPAPSDDASAGGGDALWWFAGGGVAAAGATALVGSAVFGALSFSSLQVAEDPKQFQDVSKRALDDANLQLGVAASLAATGVVLTGAGAALIGLPFVGE